MYHEIFEKSITEFINDVESVVHFPLGNVNYSYPRVPSRPGRPRPHRTICTAGRSLFFIFLDEYRTITSTYRTVPPGTIMLPYAPPAARRRPPEPTAAHFSFSSTTSRGN